MKTLVFLLAMMMISLAGISQNNGEEEYRNDEIMTLFSGDRSSGGGYFGFGAGYSVIDDMDAVVISGRGAWIANHMLAVGIAGSGFINNHHFEPEIGDDVNLAGGYGGILIEPIIFPKYPVHLSVPMIAGVGGVAYTRLNRNDDPWNYNSDWVEDEEVFLIFEPGLELEVNLLKFFRFAFGVSYRLTSDLELYRTVPDALNGFNYGFMLKFGKF